MNKLIPIIIIAIVNFSCSNVQIKNTNNKIICSKVLKTVDFNTDIYTASYKPKFYTQIELESEFTLENKSNQDFEYFEILNNLELNYKNKFTRVFPLSLTRSDSILRDGQSIIYSQKVKINELDSFDSQFLIHSVKNALLTYEVQATNSIGLNLKEKGNNLIKVDISDKWGKVEEFDDDPKFQNLTQLQDNYYPQIIGSQMYYEGWHNGITENISIIFDDELQSENPGRSYRKWDVSSWITKLKEFDLYLETLYNEFYGDTKKAELKTDNEFERLWKEWMKQRKSWIESDLMTLQLVESFFEKRDIISNSMKIEAPYNTNVDSRIKRQRRLSSFDNPNEKRTNPNYEQEKLLYDRTIAERNMKIKIIQDSIWLQIVESEKNYKVKFDSAFNSLNYALSELADLNK